MERAAIPRTGGGWMGNLLVSLLAATVAMGLMFWARAAFQIRTLPERIMEWVLLFVPLEAFEKGVQELGPQAKEIALSVGVVAMFLVLAGLALLALRSALSGWATLLIGLLLWLFAMGVVMPVTGAGFFASGLFQNIWLVNASYLGVALAYSSTILLARMLPPTRTVVDERARTRESATHARRPFLVSLAGLIASYGAVVWFGRQGSAPTSSLPLDTFAPQGKASTAAAAARARPG